jgi:hypothetical protein
MSGNHIRGWLDIARRAVVCALKGHDWVNYSPLTNDGPAPVPNRRLCNRCWKDEAR